MLCLELELPDGSLDRRLDIAVLGFYLILSTCMN